MIGRDKVGLQGEITVDILQKGERGVIVISEITGEDEGQVAVVKIDDGDMMTGDMTTNDRKVGEAGLTRGRDTRSTVEGKDPHQATNQVAVLEVGDHLILFIYSKFR